VSWIAFAVLLGAIFGFIFGAGAGYVAGRCEVDPVARKMFDEDFGPD